MSKHDEDDTLYAPVVRDLDPRELAEQEEQALPPPGKQRKPRRDLTGERFGRLLVLRKGETDTGGNRLWICRCECGTAEHSCRGTSLIAGSTRSCGCLRSELARARAGTKRGKKG